MLIQTGAYSGVLTTYSPLPPYPAAVSLALKNCESPTSRTGTYLLLSVICSECIRREGAWSPGTAQETSRRD